MGQEMEDGTRNPIQMGPETDAKDGTEDGCVAKIFAAMAHPLFAIVCSLITIVMAIIAMSEAIAAYNKLQEVSSDIGQVVDNWKMAPITGMQTVPRDQSCPNGWEEVPFADWPGSGTGSCACPYDSTNNRWPTVWVKTCKSVTCQNEDDTGCESCTTKSQTFQSTETSCSTSQQSAGCVEEAKVSKVVIDSWRGSKLCLQRDAIAAASWEDGYKKRPVPDTDGQCESGYKICNAAAKQQYRTCQPNDKTCPIVDVLKQGTSENANYTKVTFQDGKYLQVRTTGEALPMVSLANYVAQQGREDGGRCYANSPNRVSYSTASNLVTYKNSMPSKCGTGDGEKDTRVVKVDEYAASAWTEAAFRKTATCASVWGIDGKGTDTRSADATQTCTGQAKSSNGLTGSDVASDPDCAFQGSTLTGTSRQNCNNNAPSSENCGGAAYAISLASHGCKSDDDICKGILFQTKCGKLARFAARADGYFGLYRQGQIRWDEDCSADYDEMEWSNDILEGAVDTLHINMSMSVAGNIICGIIISILIIAHNVSACKSGHTDGSGGDLPCIPGEGKFEAQLIDVCASIIGPAFSIAKVTCSAVAFVSIGKIKHTFATLSDNPCSDEVTNYTCDFLGDELPSIYSSMMTNFVTEVLMFLYTIYHIVCIIMKCCNGTFGK